MRVFVTGATGFIGTAVVAELLAAGHDVVGLTRSDEGARRLQQAGAEPHRGRLEDLTSLERGAAAADAVIHLAFIHGFSDASIGTRLGAIAGALRGKSVVNTFMSSILATDSRAIHALASGLRKSGGPLLLTVGTMGLAHGRTARESDDPDPHAAGGARSVPAEAAAHDLAALGIRTSIVRLAPSVHGEGDAGFVPSLIQTARKKRAAAFVGDGSNRWPAVHRLDVARLYRLALERGTAGARYHGVAEEGIPFNDIASAIGRGLDVPVVSVTPSHFGFLGPFVAADNPASSTWTREALGWHPEGPGLLADMNAGTYFTRT